ncbi:hypothetical protein [Moorena bouillonii]|uniref:Uncharacterized protein n=1 Tax=Moorena bouillonii PNG TaxID=568701 RepID=A0A1U7MYJ8_9CYAN|nr:hypothetical protein [Moorena bouillonii]OLT58770.1 hypothetical protein BJP37_06655 [Moorena bouillonii PNG]
MSTICANPDLFVDLNQKDAETVSGGRVAQGGVNQNEIFKIESQIRFTRVRYFVDDEAGRLRFGRNALWFTDKGGKVTFDFLPFRRGFQAKTVNVDNGRKYAFKFDTSTPRPLDIKLVDIGEL